MLKKFKDKYYQLGYNDAKVEAFQHGKDVGHKEGYNQALQFCVEYYEGKKHDEYIKQEVDKVEEKVKQSKEQSYTEKFEELELFMIWISNIYEICDSNFFASYLFKDTTIDYLEGMIKYLDYLSINEDIQYMYPETINCIPEIIMSLHEVIENKKLLEETEKIIK